MDTNPPPLASNRPVPPDRMNLLMATVAVGIIVWLALLRDVLATALTSPAVAAAGVAVAASVVAPIVILMAIRAGRRRMAHAASSTARARSAEPVSALTPPG